MCLPIICSDGSVVGICGFEVSSMLCKLLYSPNCADMPRAFSAFAPVNDDNISLKNGIISGNYYHTNEIIGENITITDSNEFYSTYKEQNRSYCGVHKEISFYPDGSAFEGIKWIISVMLPQEDFEQILRSANLSLMLPFLVLLVLGIIGAFVISRRYLRPVIKAFDDIKSYNVKSAEKIKIPEIDDLFEFLASQDAQEELKRKSTISNTDEETQLESQAHKTAVFESFVNNINTLSPAEKAVFDLYVDGKTAKEIAQELYLSINTIKTHNKKIYMKLNVSSRKELLVYVQMMQELGSTNAQSK